MECLLHCSQQGIALRGHREADLEDMSVNVGNFQSLLLLQARHDDVVRERMLSGPKNDSWLGHDLQKSLMSIMAEWVLKTIMSEVKTARYYTLVVDKTKNVSKQKQLSLVLRYVYEGVAHERFISYTHCEGLHASALTKYIFQVLDGLQINIKNCINQCYNGASVMSGTYSGVSVEENLRAIYIHCHAHQLNLALVDTCKNLSAASDFFSLLESLYVFMSSSIPHSLFIKKQKVLGFTKEI